MMTSWTVVVEMATPLNRHWNGITLFFFCFRIPDARLSRWRKTPKDKKRPLVVLPRTRQLWTVQRQPRQPRQPCLLYFRQIQLAAAAGVLVRPILYCSLCFEWGAPWPVVVYTYANSWETFSVTGTELDEMIYDLQLLNLDIPHSTHICYRYVILLMCAIQTIAVVRQWNGTWRVKVESGTNSLLGAIRRTPSLGVRRIAPKRELAPLLRYLNNYRYAGFRYEGGTKPYSPKKSGKA